MKALLVLALSAIAFCSSAFGQERCTTDECLEQESYRRADATITAGDWLKAVKLPKSSPTHLKALILTGSVLFEWEGKSHCKPERADVEQAMAITRQFFQEHPQIWHLDAPSGIGVALGNVWPCGAQDDNGTTGPGALTGMSLRGDSRGWCAVPLRSSVTGGGCSLSV